MQQKPVNPLLFSNDGYEYLLIANPDESVYNKVMTEKRDFYERYNEKVAIKTKPHITVANFLAVESMEDTFIRWIQRICSQQHSFNVSLNNYSGFPPHTIYLRVQNPQPFQQLVNKLSVLDEFIKNNNWPPVMLVRKPHLTIARQLPEQVYSKAMLDYAHKDFHDSFMVTELVLLKRKNQFDRCEKVMVFKFLPEKKEEDTTKNFAPELQFA